MSSSPGDTITTAIWQDIPGPDDAYQTETALCRGYDVYADLLGKASYFEYLFLLFRGEKPAPAHAKALEILAFALANPGPRDPSVHAAMAAGVTGAAAAAVLSAALAVGAGAYGGAREVLLACQQWQQLGMQPQAWQQYLRNPPPPTREDVWPECKLPAGFASYGQQCAQPVLLTLEKLAATLAADGQVAWLKQHRPALELAAGHPLSMAGLAAATFTELEFAPATAEMLYLMLRLPGAAAHALEQYQLGFRKFPFFALDLQNDPGPATSGDTEAA